MPSDRQKANSGRQRRTQATAQGLTSNSKTAARIQGAHRAAPLGLLFTPPHSLLLCLCGVHMCTIWEEKGGYPRPQYPTTASAHQYYHIHRCRVNVLCCYFTRVHLV